MKGRLGRSSNGLGGANSCEPASERSDRINLRLQLRMLSRCHLLIVLEYLAQTARLILLGLRK